MRVSDYLLFTIAAIIASYCFFGYETTMVLGLMVNLSLGLLNLFSAGYTVAPEDEEGDE